ncbi:unnamed protein product, partial [Nesidiocoris tenuis]
MSEDRFHQTYKDTDYNHIWYALRTKMFYCRFGFYTPCNVNQQILRRRRGEDRPKGKVIGWRATVVRAKAEATGSEEGKEDGYSRSNEITFSPHRGDAMLNLVEHIRNNPTLPNQIVTISTLITGPAGDTESVQHRVQHERSFSLFSRVCSTW